MKALVTAIMVALIWGSPAYALVHNRAAPSYESALGVAYAWMIGLAIGVLVTPIVGALSVRFQALRFNAYVVAAAWLSLLAAAPVANSGQFSVV